MIRVTSYLSKSRIIDNIFIIHQLILTGNISNCEKCCATQWSKTWTKFLFIQQRNDELAHV